MGFGIGELFGRQTCKLYGDFEEFPDNCHALFGIGELLMLLLMKKEILHQLM